MGYAYPYPGCQMTRILVLYNYCVFVENANGVFGTLVTAITESKRP